MLVPLLLASTLSLSVPPGTPALPGLLDVARGAGSFTTLTAAVEAAGLTGALEGDDPLTVFAPTDEAFAALPPGTVQSLLRPENRQDLIAVLTYHVVPGAVSGADALVAGEAATLQGEALAFGLEAGALRVNEATVLANDVAARNGVIHVIDSVLLPPGAAPVDAARSLVSVAVARGVPLFNNGQPAACAAVYEVAARALAALPCGDLSPAARAEIDRGVERAMAQRDPVDRAWTLRHVLDTAAATLALGERSTPASSGDAPTAEAAREKVLFDFAGAGASAWPSVNDDVMGGISRGGSRVTGNGTILFTGALSLENNGGFSTMRSRARDLDLADWDGLLLRVRGDGRSYTLSCLADDSRRELDTWQREFATEADEWVEVRVPFDALAHRVMGWVRPDSPVDRGAIRSLAVGVSDKDTRPFALEVDWIKAYREG